MKWKQEEEKSEERRKDQMEILNEIEERLLAEGPYNDQIVIYDENTEIVQLSPPEEINQRPICNQKEYNIDNFAQLEDQKVEFKDREANLLSTVEDGFKDQYVIHGDETEELGQKEIRLVRSVEVIETQFAEKSKEDHQRKEDLKKEQIEIEARKIVGARQQEIIPIENTRGEVQSTAELIGHKHNEKVLLRSLMNPQVQIINSDNHQSEVKHSYQFLQHNTNQNNQIQGKKSKNEVQGTNNKVKGFQSHHTTKKIRTHHSMLSVARSNEPLTQSVKSLNQKQDQNADEKTNHLFTEMETQQEFALINRNPRIKDKSYSTQEIVVDCTKLFPLNQGKGNYWSVMREYVKRFELLEGLEKLCSNNANIVKIKEYIKNTFVEWAEETAGKDGVPKYHIKILNITISDYIDTLRSVTDTGNGFYKILFDFNGLKDQISLLGKPMCYVKNAFSAGLLNSYRITKHWEGTFFRIPEKEMGGEKYHRSANIFIFYLRSELFQYREIMEQSIVNKLKELHITSLGKNLEKPYNFRIKKIWSKYHLSPQNIINNAIIIGTEKHKLLERSKIQFHLLNAKELLISLFEEFNKLNTKYPDFNMRFRKVFCNSNIMKHSQKLNPIIKTIIEEQPFRYVNKSTLNELREPILWMGNQLRFASPTNESIKSGAIRYFLDIVLNSPEGRKILINAGMIDSEDKSLLISDWSTGLGTSTIQQASGLLDAVVRTKEKENRCIVKFGVEIIGSDKIKQGPLASLKNIDELRHSVIGDFLRIACNSAGGIPGIVVVTSNNHNGDLVYTVFKYDTAISENLRKYGATFAIDLNRKKVKRILQKYEDVLEILRETYGDTDMVISENILKILPKYSTLGYMYRFYFNIITKIIME